jgi:hypothetical protein
MTQGDTMYLAIPILRALATQGRKLSANVDFLDLARNCFGVLAAALPGPAAAYEFAALIAALKRRCK